MATDRITVDRINATREEVLAQIILSIHAVKAQLVGDEVGCSFECRSLLLGALVKYMHDDGFHVPGLIASSEGRSLTAVIQRVRDMKSPSLNWHPQYVSFLREGVLPCKVSLHSLIEPRLEEVLRSICGLCWKSNSQK